MTRVTGICYALFAYDVGFSVDLDEAERRLGESRGRKGFKNRRRAPTREGPAAAPLRVTQEAATIDLGGVSTAPAVDSVLFDFGGACVTYRIPFDCELESLVTLSDSLYDNDALLADSRKRIGEILTVIGSAVQSPHVSEIAEDYVIFEIAPSREERGIWWLLEASAAVLARILRAETGTLSKQEVNEAVSHRLSYTPEDAAVIDWFSAVLLGEDMQDERFVLEHATVQLLEVRLLDRLLDRAVDAAYDALSRRGRVLGSSRSEQLKRVARMQADYAVLFEAAHHGVKLLGDQYLARLYNVVSDRFRLAAWEAAIDRKLGVLEGIYEKLLSLASARRMEALEWIIIVLIAVEIVLQLMPP